MRSRPGRSRLLTAVVDITRKAACAACLFLVSGCNPVQAPTATGPDGRSTPGVVDVWLADAKKPLRLRAGQRLRVHLPASPGRRWIFEGGDEAILPLEQDPGGRMLDPTDTPAHFVWSFRAHQAGRAVLRFSARRVAVEAAGEVEPDFEVVVE